MENNFLYKLIILYMLDRVNEYMLTNEQIVNFITEKGYTNYFTVYNTLEELLLKEFISVDTIRKIPHYKITNAGEDALLFFENRIPDLIKKDVLDYFKTEKIKLKYESQTYADYYPSSIPGEFIVEGCVKEKKDTLFNIKIAVLDEQTAKKACDNWRDASSSIYTFVAQKLCADNNHSDIINEENIINEANTSNEGTDNTD